MPSPLASQTIARIQQALRSKEAASLPEVIKLIEELSDRAFSISVQELADLIQRPNSEALGLLVCVAIGSLLV